MNEKPVDRRNFDVVTIRAGHNKPASHVQNAYRFDPKTVQTPGKFIRVFADIFLRKEAGKKSYI